MHARSMPIVPPYGRDHSTADRRSVRLSRTRSGYTEVHSARRLPAELMASS